MDRLPIRHRPAANVRTTLEVPQRQARMSKNGCYGSYRSPPPEFQVSYAPSMKPVMGGGPNEGGELPPMTAHRDDASAGRWARGFLAAWEVVYVLAVFPYSMLPTVDIKWLVLAVGALISIALLARSFQLAGSAPVLLLLAGTFWYLLGARTAVNAGLAAVETSHLVAYLLLFMAGSAAYRRPEHVNTLITAFVCAIGASSLYGFAQFFGWDPLPWDPALMQSDEYRHLPATLGNPNVAGHALILALIGGAIVAVNARRRWLIVVVGLSFAHLLLTRHRAGFIALLAAAVFLAVMALVRKRIASPARAAPASVLIALLLGACVIGAAVTAQYARGGSLHDHSLLLRLNSVYSAARMAVARPLTGHGIGHFEIANPPYWTSYEQENYARAGRYNSHAHNEYAHAAAEGGFVAAGLYLAFFMVLAMRGAASWFSSADDPQRRTGLLCAALAFAFAVDSSFGFNWRAPVSGGIAALLMGACEGVIGPRPTPQRLDRVRWGIALLAAAGCVAVASVTFAAQRDLLRAKGAMYWGARQEADRFLSRAEARAPWNWALPYERGLLARAAGDRQVAITAFHRALELHPNHIPARMAMCRTLLQDAAPLPDPTRNARIADIESHLSVIENLCPVLPELFEVRGNVAALRASTESQPEARDALLRDALALYRHAIACGSPDRARVLLAASAAAQQRGDASAALDFLRNAVLDPAAKQPVFDAFMNLAEHGQRLDLVLDTLAEQRARLARNAQSDSAYAAFVNAYLAYAQHKTGDTASALQRFSDTVCDAPPTARVWELFYGVALDADDLAVVRDAFTRCAANSWSSDAPAPLALQIIAFVWTAQPQDIHGAQQRLAAALSNGDPYRPSEQDRALGWVADAVARAAVESNADAPTLLNAAILLNRTGRYSAALTRLDALSAPNIDTGILIRERAYALIGTGDPSEAEHLVRDQMKKAPRDLDLQLLLARALAAQGRQREATFQYDLLRTNAPPGSPLYNAIARDLGQSP